MTDQQQTEDLDRVWEVRRRWVGIVAFLFGAGVVLGFFGFWPGLPHVVDWGAVLVAVLVGAVARWAAQGWVNRLARRRAP
ncbi:hypothetical protein ABT131_23730 [Streptomyces sp900105245]|uniref:hypothetical protein n=1 Tax=Streptomyces sp. 900105245 TaxID=3154379 RepID=UPI00331EC726